MSNPSTLRRLVSLLALCILLPPLPVVAQKDKKDKQPPPGARPVLWQSSNIASRDLFLGPGGNGMKPDLRRITFVEEERGGFSLKYRVRDRSGRTWVAKIGKEAQPETAAVRLAWAVGYTTEINYLVPCLYIAGAPKPRKDVRRCGEGGFANVRLEARPDNVKRLDEWKWKKNPFAGTKELRGLIVLMSLMNNWDLKDANNKVLWVRSARGGNELHYIVSDLGATFGKTGNFITRSRNRPEHYVKTKYVKKVERERVRFSYHGKNGDLLNNITVADARWIGDLLAQLSDQQLRDAFRAANFAPEEILMLSRAVRAKINQLVNLPVRTS